MRDKTPPHTVTAFTTPPSDFAPNGFSAAARGGQDERMRNAAFVLPLLLPVIAHATDKKPSQSDDFTLACLGPESKTLIAQAVCEHLSGVRDNTARQFSTAEAHYRKAVALFPQLTPRRKDLEAISMISLADLLGATGRIEEAEKLMKEAGEIAPPKVMPSALGHLGALYGRTADPERGRPLLTEAIRIFEQPEFSKPGELAYAYNALGMMDLAAGKYTAGESGFRKALELGAPPETIDYQTNLALALYMEGRSNQAEILLQRARPGADEQQNAAILADLAVVESALNRFGTAEDIAEQALAALRRGHAEDSPEVVAMQVSLGSIYLREHKTREAAKILPRAVELERGMAIDARLRGDGIRRLADLRAQQRHWAEAASLYREAIALYEERFGSTHPDIDPLRREYASASRAAARGSHPA
jgi:tetratricopeptide (TPR) repeat protein